MSSHIAVRLEGSIGWRPRFLDISGQQGCGIRVLAVEVAAIIKTELSVVTAVHYSHGNSP